VGGLREGDDLPTVPGREEKDMIHRLPEGIHLNVPMAEYIADPCEEPSLSASTICTLIERSPARARQFHPRFGGSTTVSRPSDRGSAAHAVLLEGVETLHVITEFDNYRKKAAQAERDEAYAQGKTPIFEEEFEAIQGMANTARKALEERAPNGIAEATLIWREGDVWARARPDWLAGPVVDLKTAKNAEPDTWIRRVLYPSGYDLSAAWYLRGLEALGEPREEYLFLVQELFTPYDFSWITIDEESLERANKVIDKAVSIWSRCLSTRVWPGYDKRIHRAAIPAHKAERYEDFETRPV
jgi:hypothetical protein